MPVRAAYFSSPKGWPSGAGLCLLYLSGLLAGRLEFGLLARLFDLLVFGEAVRVLGAHGVVLLSEDLPG